MGESENLSPPEATLGGYFREHQRPPAFKGSDGTPYSVSLEVEMTPNLAAPYEGYLVFPRWAANGLGVVGHVETPVLCRGRSRDAVLHELGELSIHRVKELLDDAIRRGRDDLPDANPDEGR
ncbi:MAG: hypothetical protein EXR92_01080 [Gemmatimonadetes bacterium]|nr:hypothetical protein [Gemmatimonadota bacterium]